jgi:hypothetical protein
MQAIFQLSVGLNDKDAKIQIIPRDQAVGLICGAVGDCTILDAVGCFTHASGERVRENSLVVYVYGEEDDAPRVRGAARSLCRSLNQECVVVQMTRENGSFTTDFISE